MVDDDFRLLVIFFNLGNSFGGIYGCSGYTLLRDPQYNKGIAFTIKERDTHYLRGLLPPAVVTQELQVAFMINN